MKLALITGAAGGLGAAIAIRFAQAGYRVAVLDNNAEQIAAQARAIDGARAYCADIADEASVERTVEQICADFGAAPDVLVNNAGIVRFGPFLEHSVADFRRVVDVNLVGTFIVSRSVGRRMAERRRGAVINITSLNAVAVSPDAGAYPATKAAIAKLTEHMALSLAPFGIRVNAVAPGFIDAGMSAPIYRDADVRKTRASAVPAGRLGTADDVADAVLFLASDQASYIHGQHILVDGGVFCSLKNHLPRKPPVADKP